MTYQQFYNSMLNLKEFINEQDKLNAVIKVISPTSTGIVEFGNKFIDDYIIVVEDALNDPLNWVSWFVFDNDFGKNKLKVVVNSKSFKICDEKQLYDFCVVSQTIAKPNIQKLNRITYDKRSNYKRVTKI